MSLAFVCVPMSIVSIDLSLSSFVLSSVFVTAFLPKDFIISMNDCSAFLAFAAYADCSLSPFFLFLFSSFFFFFFFFFFYLRSDTFFSCVFCFYLFHTST